MSSPFAIFRKHQKIMLVVLVGLSMLSFVIFDAVQQASSIGEMPPTLVVLTIALLVGAVAWVVGISNHKASEYGSIGLIAGLAIGLLFVFRGRGADAVITNEFSLSRNDLNQLVYARSKANEFLAQAIYRTHPGLGEMERSFVMQNLLFGFGEADQNQDVVLGEVLRHEARKLGMSIPDSAVHEYINRVTSNEMTRELFREIRSDVNISERELVEFLRRELLAREAATTMFSMVGLPPAVGWEFSKRMQVRETATTAAVPVSAFVDDSATPTQAELEELFAKYRSNAPGFTASGHVDEGRPGFVQPTRIKLAYVTPDDQAFERQVEGQITDAMIEERYQRDYVEPARKATEGTLLPGGSLLPDGPLFPGGPTIPNGPAIPGAPVMPNGPALPGNNQPAQPATTPPAGEAPAATPPATETPPTTPPEAAPPAANPPAANPPAANPPAGESPSSETPTPQTPETPQPGTDCDDAPAADSPAAEATPAATTPEPAAPATPAAEAPATDAPATEAPATTAPATDAATPPAPAQPAGDDPFPGTPETPPPTPTITVPPLDDQLKLEIRDQLLMEKTNEAIDAAMAEALQVIRNQLARDVNAPQGTSPRLSLEEATKRVIEYAETHHLRYVESPLMSAQELLKSDDYPVAQFARTNAAMPFQSNTVAEELVRLSPNDIFRPRQIEERDQAGRVRDRAIYWKLEHVPSHMPDSLNDERVKEQVIQTWRELKARDAAQARARALADEVRMSGKSMLEALSDVTITGEPGTTLLSILTTGQFSWMRQTIVPSTNLHGFDFAPVQSQIPGIEPVGEQFMQIVFDELQPGDVGVAPSQDHSVYYVVKVDSRIPGTPEEWNIVRNNYLAGENDQMVSRMSADLVNQEVPNWKDRLFRKYEVQLAGSEQE